MGRGEADGFSDIDVWLTFPDETIEAVIADRWTLYGKVGDLLIAHEMTPNRPVGGIYSFVLYRTPVGPMVIDWSLAPRRSSRIDVQTMTIFADEPIPPGERQIDSDAEHVASKPDSVTWLICMLFVAIKMVARGEGQRFLPFLGQAYRDIGRDCGLDGLLVTEPGSFAEISSMLRQLLPASDEQQRRAIDAIDEWLHDLGETARVAN